MVAVYTGEDGFGRHRQAPVDNSDAPKSTIPATKDDSHRRGESSSNEAVHGVVARRWLRIPSQRRRIPAARQAS